MIVDRPGTLERAVAGRLAEGLQRQCSVVGSIDGGWHNVTLNALLPKLTQTALVRSGSSQEKSHNIV